MHLSLSSRLLRPAAVLLVATLMLGACSERQPTAPDTPWLPESGDIVRAEVTLGGVLTSYSAYFETDQLRRITEIRKPAPGSTDKEHTGEYVFNGARLTQYQGIAIGSPRHIQLTLDMRGVLTNSSGDIDDSELAAVRNRAQLLRSLALAKRGTQSHSREQ